MASSHFIVNFLLSELNYRASAVSDRLSRGRSDSAESTTALVDCPHGTQGTVSSDYTELMSGSVPCPRQVFSTKRPNLKFKILMHSVSAAEAPAESQKSWRKHWWL